MEIYKYACSLLCDMDLDNHMYCKSTRLFMHNYHEAVCFLEKGIHIHQNCYRCGERYGYWWKPNKRRHQSVQSWFWLRRKLHDLSKRWYETGIYLHVFLNHTFFGFSSDINCSWIMATVCERLFPLFDIIHHVYYLDWNYCLS